MKAFPALLLSLLLVACVTSPPSALAPTAHVYAKSVAPSQSTAKIVVVRDKSPLPLLLSTYLHFYINNEVAASLYLSERVELTLASGEYTFGVKPNDLFGIYAMDSIDQTLQSGRTYYYQLSVNPNAETNPDSVARIQRTRVEDSNR